MEVHATTDHKEQLADEAGISQLNPSVSKRDAGQACLHCHLPVPKGLQDPRFCCPGCKAVHFLLGAQGLSRFYDLGGGAGHPVGSVPQPQQRAWLAELQASGQMGGNRVRLQLDVQGIHCAACVYLIRELWRRRGGALHLELNPSLGQLELSYDENRLDLTDFLDEVESLGYRFAPASKKPAAANRGLLLRLGVCVALALNAMMFALAGYLGLGPEEATTFHLFRWLSMLLSTLAVLVGGPVFFRAALAGLRGNVLHLDLPISLGILLAYGGSLFHFFTRGGYSYFDTVTVFVALMLVGRYLQSASLRRNRDYLLANDGAQHLRVRRLQDGGMTQVPVLDLHGGDRLLLSPGDLVPVRSRLVNSGASFSFDWINGESEPRWLDVGEQVVAGAFLSGPKAVQVEALADAQDSGLLNMLTRSGGAAQDMVANAPFWSWLNRSYVLLVLGLAAAAGILWSFLDPTRVVEVTTAVLVVTCPCALGLATPLAVDLVLALLRRRGIYVRHRSMLEKARHVRKVVLDKTGTLTWGDIQMQELRPLPDQLRDLLLTMVSTSNHPLSRAILTAKEGSGFTFMPDLEVEEVPGSGLRVQHAGHEYRLGSRSFVFAESARQDDGELVMFSCDGQVQACFQKQEDLKPGFMEEIARLQGQGKQVFMLSGDGEAKVQQVARALGLPEGCYQGDVSPAAKASFIRDLDQSDTMMVGDGINDAPAFDAAYCAGAAALDRPVMPARADFFFLGSGVGAISSVLSLSHAMHRVIWQNLCLAGIYNLVAVTLCFMGLMTPLLCAVLMPLSSLLLIAHTAMRLRSVAAREERVREERA